MKASILVLFFGILLISSCSEVDKSVSSQFSLEIKQIDFNMHIETFGLDCSNYVSVILSIKNHSKDTLWLETKNYSISNCLERSIIENPNITSIKDTTILIMLFDSAYSDNFYVLPERTQDFNLFLGYDMITTSISDARNEIEVFYKKSPAFEVNINGVNIPLRFNDSTNCRIKVDGSYDFSGIDENYDPNKPSWPQED